jgi:transcriptional regulator with XRE-family HTH domain
LALVNATVEAAVGDNWAAVAEAIRNRVAELDVTQKDLAARSGVSESTIRQLMNNYGPRRRARHTLEDISKGLQWPAHYLSRVLDATTESSALDAGGAWHAELAALRSQVTELADRVAALEHGRQNRQ